VLPLKCFKEAIGNGEPAPGSAESSFPAGDETPFAGTDRLPTLKQAENWLVAEALRRTDGNQVIAARMLGITRQALNQRLKRKKR
jgi:DNA-binding NtrC family response regulator